MKLTGRQIKALALLIPESSTVMLGVEEPEFIITADGVISFPEIDRMVKEGAFG